MSKSIKVGINGFGRIGRNLFRLLLDHPKIDVVAINDLADAKTLSHLLKYDSIHGVLHRDVSFSEKSILVDNTTFRFSSEKNIEDINWDGVDMVVESTGKFKLREQLEKHIKADVK
ncbi:glyceraldehyde 3-phosphate dehydrogenase NAD-binding domain-containing protein, partial [uncultured Marixanthomonas sp.]|uniref:glyceraldehyde 3-phosphate dehydrogenase NAD-binding domain-containing protein n=1 Tax=uncultured Marixanthomonas sp. TaxID=757245 RepID=UPI0030D7E750